MKRSALFLLLLSACTSPASLPTDSASEDPPSSPGPDPVSDASLAPRSPLRTENLDPEALGIPQPGQEIRLVVKFRDGLSARVEGMGRMTSPTPSAMDAVNRLASSWNARFSPLIQLPQGKVTSLLRRGALRTGRAQPDLLSLHQVTLDGASSADLALLGEALDSLAVVEFVALERGPAPPPGDIAPTTSDYTAMQDYLNPNPGINANHAHSLGYDGSGMGLIDVEYAFTATHEDLGDAGVSLEPGQTPAYPTYADHGTSTLGEILSPHNGYGCSGIAPGATGRFYTEWSSEEGSRRAAAVTNACADSLEGDVVMLEMQTYGMGGAYVPAEYDLSVWTAVKACTDAGVVVVAAAGNGNANLSSPPYSAYRLRGDSFAIIVGAGTGGTDGRHNRESFSTYGNRVNVQGWGSSVFTSGYGDYITVGGDSNQRYTAAFSGTSSATPIVSGAALVLQQASLDLWGVTMTPVKLRALLMNTGIPQGRATRTTRIGPLPDLSAALVGLETDADGDGFGYYTGDCLDTDLAVNPSAAEVVDGVDNDCDDLIDEM